MTTVSNVKTAIAPTKKPTTTSLLRAYSAELTATVGKGSPITITAPLPVNYQLQFGTNYDNPFNSPLSDVIGGRIGPIAGNVMTGVTGMSSRNKWLSSTVWQGGNSFSLTIPFVIVAKSDARQEVLKKMRDMLKLVAPSESTAGMLRAPGPNLNTAANSGSSDVGFTGEMIKVRLGEFFEMEPCVIENVTCDFDTQMDIKDKCPMSVTITVTVLSYWTTTREDIDQFFKNKLEPTTSA